MRRSKWKFQAGVHSAAWLRQPRPLADGGILLPNSPPLHLQHSSPLCRVSFALESAAPASASRGRRACGGPYAIGPVGAPGVQSRKGWN